MNKIEAYSWLTQPGILATLLHYDRDTNEALKIAIKSLGEDIDVYKKGYEAGVEKLRKDK